MKRFARLIGKTSLHGKILPKRADMAAFIDAETREDKEFNNNYRVISEGESVSEQDIFGDNLSYLRVVSIGSVEGGNLPHLCVDQIRGPTVVNIPPRLWVYEFPRKSSLGDRVDEIVANTQNLEWAGKGLEF